MSKNPNFQNKVFQTFAADLKLLFGAELHSIILFGSAAKGDFLPKTSDINFLVVVSDKAMSKLPQCVALVDKWQSMNLAVPLFMTEAELIRSLDTFPVEYLDMKQSHRTLYGKDILADIKIERGHLRNQIERELRSKLIHLRSSFLGNGHRRGDLLEMLSLSVTPISMLLAALIFLKSQAPPSAKRDVLQNGVQLFGLNNDVVVELINVREGRWRGSVAQLQIFTMKYISEIEKLVKIVDTFNPEADGNE